MTLFDANSWLGSWPFAYWPERDAQAHAMFLRRQGIDRALVSPLQAVFTPEPGPANHKLLADTKPVRALLPVPVINPALANWREQLEAVANDQRVRAVRWLPAYHNYRLTGRRIDACAAELQERKLKLVLTVRLVDERHEYFALRIKGLTNAALDPFLARHSQLPILLTGLLRPDLTALVPRHPHALADLSFAEWDRTLERILEHVPVRQVVFGSHAPFLIAAANVSKVTTARLPPRQLAAVARQNLEAFLIP